MNINTIKSKLELIIQDVLDNQSLLIEEIAEIVNVEGWDSLAHINIVSQIESEFEIRFSLEEMATFSNIEKITDAIVGKIHKHN
jgi:acyl carrier protein